MPPRRRTAPSSNARRRERTTTSSTRQRLPPDSGSTRGKSFNDLPAELRNAILIIPAQDITTVLIRPHGAAHVTTSHPLTLVSRGVHKDFNGLIGSFAPLIATKVIAKVEDLDFNPLMAFMRRVAATAGASVQDFHDGAGGRMLKVDLHFTAAFVRNPPTEKIARFWRFVKEPKYACHPVLRVESVADKEGTDRLLRGMAGWRAAGGAWGTVTNEFEKWVQREKIRVNKARKGENVSLRRKLDQRSLLMRLHDKRVEEEYEAVYAEQMAVMQARVPPQRDGGEAGEPGEPEGLGGKTESGPENIKREPEDDE